MFQFACHGCEIYVHKKLWSVCLNRLFKASEVQQPLYLVSYKEKLHVLFSFFLKGDGIKVRRCVNKTYTCVQVLSMVHIGTFEKLSYSSRLCVFLALLPSSVFFAL